MIRACEGMKCMRDALYVCMYIWFYMYIKLLTQGFVPSSID